MAVPSQYRLEDVNRLLGNVMNFLHGLTKPCVQKCRNENLLRAQAENEEVWTQTCFTKQLLFHKWFTVY